MIKSICPHYCPAPFCLSACPTHAILVVTKGENKILSVDTDICNGCGICRAVCMAWSQDKNLEKKLFWLSSKPE